MKCSGAAHAAKCSSECEDGLTSRACINFLGSSYVQCGSCFSLVDKIKAKGEAIIGQVRDIVKFYLSCTMCKIM